MVNGRAGVDRKCMKEKKMQKGWEWGSLQEKTLNNTSSLHSALSPWTNLLWGVNLQWSDWGMTFSTLYPPCSAWARESSVCVCVCVCWGRCRSSSGQGQNSSLYGDRSFKTKQDEKLELLLRMQEKKKSTLMPCIGLCKLLQCFYTGLQQFIAKTLKCMPKYSTAIYSKRNQCPGGRKVYILWCS
jgi:hypothetical protein